jgi:hypothetical protein
VRGELLAVRLKVSVEARREELVELVVLQLPGDLGA